MNMVPNKIYLLSITLAFSICFSAFECIAQESEPAFRHYTTEHGLSQNLVRCIYKDSRGFMWFGTKDGLNKFNAYDFQVYKKGTGMGSGLSSNNIIDILEDKNGVLWVGTAEGLSEYDRETNTFRTYSPNDSTNIFVNDIFEDKEGTLWISTTNSLYQFDPGNKSFTLCRFKDGEKYDSNPYIFYKVVQEKDGTLWIATSRGLKTFSLITNKIEHPNSDINVKEINGSIRSLFIDSRDFLWIGIDNQGVYRKAIDSNEIKAVSSIKEKPAFFHNKAVHCIAEDNSGDIWVAIDNGGILVFNSKSSRIRSITYDFYNQDGLNSNSIRTIYKDDIGNMWIGTWAGGVNFLPRFADKFLHFKPSRYQLDGLNSRRVKSVLEDKDQLVWIGTDGGGVNVYDRKSQSFRYIRSGNENGGLSSDYVHCITELNNDTLIIGYHNNGFDFLDKRTGKVFPYSSLPGRDWWKLISVRAVFKDTTGKLWVGTTNDGLFRIDTNSGEVEEYSTKRIGSYYLRSNSIFTIGEDNDNNLWVGTEHGLNIFDKETNQFKNFHYQEGDVNSLSDNSVNTFLHDSRNRFWVGTNDGLNLWDPKTSSFTSVTRNKGLASEVIQGILEDSKGNLWLSSNSGLIHFEPGGPGFRHYSIVDGLQSNEFVAGSYFKNKAGEMYFGGVNGFNLFHPDSITHNPYLPPVVLTGFHIFNENVESSNHPSFASHIGDMKKINLSYHESFFSIEFAALNFINPQENQYAYKMEGFDKNWNHVGNKRSATYTNLDPGGYLFRVKASNNDGLWNEEGASIFILISPPFWKTWWFTSTIILTVVLFAFALIKANTNRITLKNHELEARIAERTEQIEAQKKEIEAQRDNLNKLNQAITQQNQVLEQKVKERTGELVEYNHQLEQFAFIAAHNLRAPVARILGLGNVMKISAMDPSEEKFITEKLISTTEELDRVVKDINVILEIRKNNTVQIDEVDIIQEIKIIRTSLENEIMETGTEFTEEFSVSRIKTIKPYFNSIIYNLISNAIKYRYPGRKPQISITTREQDKYILIEVGDNGLGIDLENHKHNVFNLYKRFHTHVEGKGMGLYLVKTQVTALGGTIDVESKVNEGTTFKILLKNGQPA